VEMPDTQANFVTRAFINDMKKVCPFGVFESVLLSEVSRWKIGGKADLIIRPNSVEQISSVRNYFYRNGIPHVIIGHTTNLLFSDNGIKVPCIQIDGRLGKIVFDKTDQSVVAHAGVWIPRLAVFAMRNGLSGAEHICGIPGTLGGLICMNGGSQRKSISSALLSVESVDAFGDVKRRSVEYVQFGYRKSIFQTNGEVITEARLRFSKGDRRIVRKTMLSILSDRRRKFPNKLPNCGSVFKSDPKMYELLGPPGVLIEKAGYKGLRKGGAKVSELHANFIVNLGDAKSSDVIWLTRYLINGIYTKYDIRLVPEYFFVSEYGQILSIDNLTD
jgi:UDP-N-acetylmuramate dehydrogenase